MVACLVGFFLFFLPPSTIPVGIFLVAHFLPSLFVVYQYVSEWEERGKNVEKTSWYILVMPCRQPHGVIELPPDSSARSYYPPSKMEIESIRVHQIGSALLLLMPSRHRIIPQRIAGYV